MTKEETIAKMTDKFCELVETSATNHVLMAELYKICHADLIVEVDVIDLSTFNQRLSEL